ncbi:MAG: pantoate--beta-alanine ligase [Desulfosudaceae bacterium]
MRPFPGARREAAIKIIKTIAEMKQEAEGIRQAQGSLVLIPTMGFLHEGHLSLIREGKKYGDYIILSIFVNPTQFGPDEDYETYPQDFDRDVAAAEREGVTAVFAPEAKELYRNGFETYVNLEKLPRHLCGLSRPTHFQGVATIVVKLFNIIRPRVAVFGSKDYQQLAIIRRLTEDLNLDIQIVGAPIVREEDGVAMSSRNAYLTEKQRASAPVLHESLLAARQMVREGETRAGVIIEKTAARIRSYPETAIDYISICHPDTLDDVEIITGPVVMALAVQVGPRCRLIDNMTLAPAPENNQLLS